MRSSYAISIAFTLAVPLSGCVLGAGTGAVVPGTVAGTEFSLFGYSNVPNTTVTSYVLSNPNSLSSPWVSLGTAVTSTDNQAPSGDTPQYAYQLSTTGVSATEWPQGGLVRLEAKSIYANFSVPTNMVTFTNEGDTCIDNEIGEGLQYTAIGESCESPYGGNVIIEESSTPTPYQQKPTTTDYLSFPFGTNGAKPNAGLATTQNYYQTINAPQTLANPNESNFQGSYGYSVAGNGLVNAKYYNAGDLGIGRDMYCWAFGTTMAGRACYVTNYGRDTSGDVVFGLDPQTVISEVIAGVNPVATVAMVYNPTLTSNVVQFMVYDGSGNLSDYAALDNVGVPASQNLGVASNANINIPNNCLTCHGQSSTFTSGVVSNAFFLPFDPAANIYAPTANLVFSTSDAAYEQAAMMPAIAQLNAHVYATHPSAAIQSFINGAYSTTNGPTASSTFNDSYVPPGWATPTGTLLGPGTQTAANPAASTQVYNEVIKPFCRTCHFSNTEGLDWTTEAQFDGSGEPGIAWSFTCNGNGTPMPNALQAQNRFWDSPARAHMAAAFGLSGGCTP